MGTFPSGDRTSVNYADKNQKPVPVCQSVLSGKNKKRFRGITDLQNKFNEVSKVVAALDKALDEYAAIKDWIDELREYMESGQWRKDFEEDEKGEVPSYIRRGVLSKDALYNLRADSDRIYSWTTKPF